MSLWATNLGEFRRLTKGLSDDVQFFPAWSEEPGKFDPCVVFDGIRIGSVADDGNEEDPCLDIMVSLKTFDELAEEQEEEDDSA